MFVSNELTIQDFITFPPLLTDMEEKIELGELVCFDGDEDGLLLGVGLVVETRGDLDDLEDFDSAIRDFYDEDEYWKISHVLPAAPMIMVLWSRSPSSAESDFNLHNINKLGYSFMWVYPTEVKVITKRKNNGRKKTAD